MKNLAILTITLSLNIPSVCFALPDMTEVWRDIYEWNFAEAKSKLKNVAENGHLSEEDNLNLCLIKMFLSIEEKNEYDLLENRCGIWAIMDNKFLLD